MRPSFANNARPNRGRRECRVRAAPAVSRAKSKSTRGRHHRFTGAVRHSPRNGFNGLLRDLPGDRLDYHRHLADKALSAPGRADIASAKLDAGIEASGPHDFTVRNNIVRLRARDRSWVGPRPAIPIARRRRRVHRIPCPTSVTIAKRPSVWDGMPRVVELIWVRGEAEYFCEWGWTACPLICPSGTKSGVVPTWFAASAGPQFVIPGRAEGANPESITTNRWYGFLTAPTLLPEWRVWLLVDGRQSGVGRRILSRHS